MTNYWWANQSDNFERVKGTLWTNFLNAGGARRAGAVAVGGTKSGDVVFHCDDKFVKTVSVVVSEPVATRRPPNYQSRQSGSEDDEGWLVLVQPLVDGLRIDRRSDVPFIEHGGSGPFNKLGGLKRGIYLSALSEGTALKLMQLAGLSGTELFSTAVNDYAESFSGADLTETDQLVFAKRRVEQQYLRSVLLDESDSRCMMCHRELPESLLVAGHIKPRWACTAEEREDFTSVAMLICLLGCDSLYESSLIAVNGTGRIVRTSRSSTPDLDHALDLLAGTVCLRYSETTVSYFWWHFDHTFVG